MNEKECRQQIVETGRKLLETGLVARTWGNVSARLDEDSFLITPSGLDYNTMEEKDIVTMNISDGEWVGPHKPSGEKGVHKAAYEVYDDVNFVIHTHQTYATAIGLAGFEELEISEDERNRLGGIAIAGYGLSGTGKLTKAVSRALSGGAKTVLMIHHGALVCGKDMQDALEKALLLEEICRRSCRGQQSFEVPPKTIEAGQKLAKAMKEEYEYADILQTHQAVLVAQTGEGLVAQIDDMAQMTGRKLASSDKPSRIKALMKHHDAVVVKGLGILVKACSSDDLDALMILMQKAAIVKLHTDAQKKRITLGRCDSALMHFVYKKKYSKRKDSKEARDNEQ